MQVIRTINELRNAISDLRHIKGKNEVIASVGLVPTMGYLHKGHASLLRRARQENAVTVLSIFVNPTQFGPGEDFERYPRNEEQDLRLAEAEGIDLVFMPDVKEMYPRSGLTTVSVNGVTDKLCGASRPGHFDGVATVVSKLFHIVQPDFAYFGMKDAQQIAVIQTMVEDLNLPVQIVPCPIIREENGLAMSSRNVYLEPEHRKQALVLSESLRLAEGWYKETGGNPEQLKQKITDHIKTASLAQIDYVEILSYPSLVEPQKWTSKDFTDHQMLIALAVKFGNTRLIDNRLMPISDTRMI